MAVPRMTELRRGAHVNIVLKADQHSGKLTSGQVSDILTRGDHPRGIKVRLTDGKIGRVQSLAAPGSSTNAGPELQSTPRVSQVGNGMQDDYRLETEPEATTSLLDYVKTPKQKKRKNGGVVQPDDAMTPQQQLEAEFPKLDTALIAAILLDHDSDLVSSRATLSSLS
jgi:uncharacterized repeat protein (TIGR03833 family)